MKLLDLLSSRCLLASGPTTAAAALTSSYSTGGGGGGVMNVFDRRTKRKQRARAAMAADAHLYDYLKDHVSDVWWARVSVFVARATVQEAKVNKVSQHT